MHAPFRKLANRNLFPAPENAGKPLGEQLGGAEKYFVSVGPEPFKAQYNRLVGGSTWSWRGNIPRFLPSDFQLKSLYGIADDWPIGYSTLEPWYVRAESELGAAGLDSDWSDTALFGNRSGAFPMAPVPASYGDKLVRQSIDNKLIDGIKTQVVYTPQARNTREYQGRPACEGNHNCIPLCPIGAKYDATVHLNAARAEKNWVTLRTGCVVTRLVAGSNGAIEKVSYRNWKMGPKDKEFEVAAKWVVVAANAIETPMILLRSGLANSSGVVGRNLMDHIQDEVGAIFPVPVYPFRGPQSTLSIEAFRDGPARGTQSGFRMTIGNDAWGRKPGALPVDIANAMMNEGKWGKELTGSLSDHVSRMVRLSFSTEQLPDPSNRVELSTKLDDLGLARPQISFSVNSYVHDGLAYARTVAQRLFAAVGNGIEVEPVASGTSWNTAAHIMGTCRMGSNPGASVVDSFGRCHDHPNLFLAGSSVFVTGSTANPTLTLAALALRTADQIATETR
jgi:choline dehydrogenase-like flavoprotein